MYASDARAFFAQLSLCGTILAQACYFPDGSTSDTTDWFVCNSTADHSHCCVLGDECLTNGLCKGSLEGNINRYWRESCTDPAWRSSACPSFCNTNDTHSDAPRVNWPALACSADSYCCSYNATQPLAEEDDYSCCDDRSRQLDIGPAVFLAGAIV
ncbi:hypothetical protein BDY21DRAFT_367724 [Lineolata rhizophorae]|uniref:Extracellular membrane protein CFEM domain-containing protein n=1 Tax=Lineolata rhizophorae TaxID=578093 RepID=A0A6A6NLP0_9PEZI|nr:hypothetical protein BDY21DRAFT_367724 [Lineolata rhizophorae]